MTPPRPMAIDTPAGERSDWLDAAHTALTQLAIRAAATGEEFTADDLYALAGPPEHPGWVGAAFKHAEQQGLIRQTGITRSQRRARHGGLVRTWTSG